MPPADLNAKQPSRRPSPVAERLADLARGVQRLAPPSRHDPERFWRDKYDLAAELRRLASETRHG